MKKLRFSFAAFITLVAVGLTLAANAGAFKNTNFAPAAAGDCYTNVPVLLQSVCTEENADPTDPCNIIAIGDELRALPSGVIPEAQIPTDCPGAQNFFCCAQLEIGGSCEAQPELTIDGVQAKYKVKSVKCKQLQGN